nr:MAG TPA: hypothetical protein [Caudoviricetes sp.]
MLTSTVSPPSAPSSEAAGDSSCPAISSPSKTPSAAEGSCVFSAVRMFSAFSGFAPEISLSTATSTSKFSLSIFLFTSLSCKSLLSSCATISSVGASSLASDSTEALGPYAGL